MFYSKLPFLLIRIAAFTIVDGPNIAIHPDTPLNGRTHFPLIHITIDGRKPPQTVLLNPVLPILLKYFVQHHLILNHGLLEFSVVDVLTAGAEAAGHHLLASLDTTFGSLENLLVGLRLTLVD
jgi:hypothetical protein